MTGFESKRQAAQNKMNDAADTLSIVYQRGFADGKKAAQPEQEPAEYDKTEINCFVQSLYDEKMQEGKHGHYETMFYVVHRAIKKVASPAAQLEQQAEPVISAWSLREVYFDEDGEPSMHRSPPAAQRPWQGLTEEEASNIWDDTVIATVIPFFVGFTRAIEAKLKDRNT